MVSDVSSLLPVCGFRRVSLRPVSYFSLSSLWPVCGFSLVFTEACDESYFSRVFTVAYVWFQPYLYCGLGVISTCLHYGLCVVSAVSSLRPVCGFRRVFTVACVWF